MSTQYLTPSVHTSESVQVDPSNNGSVFRTALAAEIGLNAFISIALFFFPARVLGACVASSSAITPTSTLLVQALGIVVFGLTSLNLMSMADTRNGFESRPTSYLCLVIGNITVATFFLTDALLVSNKVSGLTNQSLLTMAAGLVALSGWRLYVLFVAPQLMGRYSVGGKKSI